VVGWLSPAPLRSLACLLQVGGDGGVVVAGVGEGFDGETLAGGVADGVAGLQFGQNSLVVLRIAEDGDAGEVFGGGAQQGDAANVYLLDGIGQRDAGLGDGLLEGVEVADDEVYGLDALRGQVGQVFGQVAGEDATVDGGVQGLDAAAEHFRRAGDFGHVLHGQTGLAQQAGSAATGDEFPIQLAEGGGKFQQPCFIVHREDGSFGHGEKCTIGGNGRL
jgi:hypothetical protein